LAKRAILRRAPRTNRSPNTKAKRSNFYKQFCLISSFKPRGAFFFAFYGTYAGGGGENGSKLKLYSYFEILEDSGCKFKLNFDGGGVKNSEKSQNSKTNCIKSFQCPEQISQEERAFIISSEKL